jgi:hypothetical protein
VKRYFLFDNLMKKKHWICLGTIILIIFVVYIAYPILVSSISVIKVESEGKNVLCYLQWHGKDQTTIKLTALADLGRDNFDYSKVVNNEEVFTVSVTANYSWVEISFNGKTFSLHSDGKNATLSPIGYT